MKLGVNIDHVATLRQARGGQSPEPVLAAALAEQAGASGITVHLREDRRHIQDRDVFLLKETVQTKLNLEMAVNADVMEVALQVKPHCACLVPERRQELTTEGGLDVAGSLAQVRSCVVKMQSVGTVVSLFIAPEEEQIIAAAKSGAQFIELHTGSFANAKGESDQQRELARLIEAAEKAHSLGLRVNAGHGLDYFNASLMHHVPYLEELNIGHSIISRAVMTGLTQAVRDMLAIIE
ncbi:pyridoxine 5'-phosphate synthase [bacterium]|nr:pyridoxine 5'-phosphate synthase [bacterium]